MKPIQLNPQDLLFFAISYVNSLLDLFIYLAHKLFERESMCFDPLIPWPIFLYCFPSHLLRCNLLFLFFTLLVALHLLLESHHHHHLHLTITITTTCIITSPPCIFRIHHHHLHHLHLCIFTFLVVDLITIIIKSQKYLLSLFRSNYHKHKITKRYLLSLFASRSNLALI